MLIKKGKKGRKTSHTGRTKENEKFTPGFNLRVYKREVQREDGTTVIESCNRCDSGAELETFIDRYVR